MFLLGAINELGRANDVPTSLVGRWDLDDGAGKDFSNHGNDAVLEGTRIYALGDGRACLELMPDTGPVCIPTSEDSPLAISRGTISLWLNVGWTHTTFLKYDNGAVELNVYRGHFQARFTGEDDFRYWDQILDYDWPKYDMREWAFYPHPRAAVGDSEWHHFVVAYDDQNRRISGWRDGELISVVDLSTVEILSGILRDYGMKLYWSPSDLLTLEQDTADQLHAGVPVFAGYMIKMGSEKQNGAPRPSMVNRIADTLKPYGGKCLVRAFVYGNCRYTPEPYRK